MLCCGASCLGQSTSKWRCPGRQRHARFRELRTCAIGNAADDTEPSTQVLIIARLNRVGLNGRPLA